MEKIPVSDDVSGLKPIHYYETLHLYSFRRFVCIEIELKRSAKKNLILRPVNMRAVGIYVPPFFKTTRWQTGWRQTKRFCGTRLPKRPCILFPTQTYPEVDLVSGE